MQLEFLLYLQEHMSQGLETFFKLATYFGDSIIYIVVISIIYWCINKNFARNLLFVVALSALINNGVKELFKNPRPFLADKRIQPLEIETATGYSFPSGHAQAVSTFWFALAKEIKKKWFTIASIAIVLLVGCSRLFLRVHYPVDVVVGLLLGTAIALLMYKFLLDEKASLNFVELNYISLMMIVVLGVFMILVRNPETLKIGSIGIGAIIGSMFENRFVRFKVKSGFLFQVLKVVLGIVFLVALKSGLKMVPYLSVDYIRYFILGIFITFVWPAIFWRFEKY